MRITAHDAISSAGIGAGEDVVIIWIVFHNAWSLCRLCHHCHLTKRVVDVSQLKIVEQVLPTMPRVTQHAPVLT